MSSFILIILLSYSLFNKSNYRRYQLTNWIFAWLKRRFICRNFFSNIKHKSNNQHVISNTFSRLFIDAFKFVVDSFVLNDDVYWQTTFQYVYIIDETKYLKHVVNKIYINMSSKFKTSIIKNYKQNKSWKQILILLAKKQKIIVIKKQRQTTNTLTNIVVSTRITILTKTIVFTTNNILATKLKWQKKQ